MLSKLSGSEHEVFSGKFTLIFDAFFNSFFFFKRCIFILIKRWKSRLKILFKNFFKNEVNKKTSTEPIEKTFFDRTEVSFANLTQEDIECYVNTGEPM